ncbi:MAG: phage protease [Pseudomonadota bacterium]
MTQPSPLRLVRSLNFTDTGGVPDWIMLIPAGPRSEARDGRWFANTNPDAVVAKFHESFTSKGVDMVVDYEDATETDPTSGHPAAGWIDKVENREGAIWGHVTWTEKASAMIAAREYRFISPVMWHHPETNEVQALDSAALTHNPALSMRALAHRQGGNPETKPGELTMTPEARKALCAKLGLAPEASDTAIATAVEELQSDKVKALASAEAPSLDKFVPRADHDKLKGDLETAQSRLSKIDEDAVEGKVDAAIKAGKIAPASRDYHVAACKADPAAFDAFIEGTPKLPVTEGSELDGKKPDDKGTSELTAEDKAMCRDLGISEEDYVKTAA